MTTPKALTIKPRFRKAGNFDEVNLKPIRTRIEQAIKSFPTGAPNRKEADLQITSTTNGLGSKTVVITIRVQKLNPPPNGGTPVHPPKRVILWQ
jgi:hypothetical protein